jgi:hypothetical protein
MVVKVDDAILMNKPFNDFSSVVFADSNGLYSCALIHSDQGLFLVGFKIPAKLRD